MTPSGDNQDKARRGPGTGWIAAHLALFFLWLELLKACRASIWGGFSSLDMLGWGAALLLYGLLAWAGTRLFLRLLPHTPLARLPGSAQAPVAGALGGALLWALLSMYREHAPTPDDALVLGALLTHSLAGAWLGHRAKAAAFGPWAGTALLAGVLSVLLTSAVHVLTPKELPQAVLLVAPASLLGAAILAWPVFFFGASRARRMYTGVLGMALAAFALICSLRVSGRLHETQTETPNLVFVIADALRADAPSFAGGPVPTPHLDALANEGARFEQAYSLGPWTMSSVSALFGSAYPPSLSPGVPHAQWREELWRYAVAPGAQPLAKQLRDQGYLTAAFTANALLWGMPGLLDDFTLKTEAHPVMLVRAGIFRACPFLWDALHALIPAWAPQQPNDCTEILERRIGAFLRDHRNRPFFLYVHHIDPHAPGDPPERFRTRDGAWPFYYPYAGGEQWGVPQLGPGFVIPESDRPYVRSLYDGEVRYIDESIGRLRSALRDWGLDKNTYLCFMSDHGEEFWEHGRWGHGQSLHQELIRVPWLIAGPGIAPKSTAQPVSSLDCMPTLAGLLGLEPQPQWQGASWASWLQTGANAPEARPVFVQGTSDSCWPHPQQAVIWEGHKLIRGLGQGPLELFRLDTDPGDLYGLQAEDPEHVGQLQRLLDQWQNSFPCFFSDPAQSPPSAGERRQALDGMGYLQ